VRKSIWSPGLWPLGRAPSDSIRVRMLGMMREGRGCYDLPDLGVPAGEDENPGICVCEFEDYFGLGQCAVSYQMRSASLVREKRRDKWSSTRTTRGRTGAPRRSQGAVIRAAPALSGRTRKP